MGSRASARDEVGFIPCRICKKPQLAPSNEDGTFACLECTGLERENISRTEAETEGSEATSSKKIVHKLKLDKAKTSSRAKEALKIATGSSKFDSQRSRKEPVGAFARSKPDVPDEDNFEVGLMFGKLSQTLETMEGELTCPICLELFAKPVTLNEWYEYHKFVFYWLTNYIV
jgi:hypothetical protein